MTAPPATRSSRLVERSLGVVTLTWRHPSNRGRRFRAVARTVAFQVRGRLTGHRMTTPVGEHSRIWADVGSYISARAVYGNPLDWNEMQAWRTALGPGSFFVDVGANVGLYSIWALDLGAEVLAVEPGSEAVYRLRENLELNGYDPDVLRSASEKPRASCG